MQDGRCVVAGPLLGDHPVGEPVHIHRIPAHPAAGGGEPEQVALVGPLDHETDRDGLARGHDVLLGRMQVGERREEAAQHPDEATGALDGAEGLAVPDHPGCRVLRGQVRVVLVHDPVGVLANDPDVLLGRRLADHDRLLPLGPILAASSNYIEVAMNQAQTRPVPLTADEEAVVRAFAHAVITVPRALDADLLRGQGMSLSEYNALMNLSEAPGHRLRMGDLAAACDLSISGMTRIVNRLVEQDLVRRERSPDDGRGWNAMLTETGLQRLRHAWPIHLASMRRHVLDHLQALDLPALTAALQRFATDAPHTDPNMAP
jgi:DNA-binding MarR family transcriptional regulator